MSPPSASAPDGVVVCVSDHAAALWTHFVTENNRKMILIIHSLCDRALIPLLLDFVVLMSSMKRYCDVMKDGFWCFSVRSSVDFSQN